jgi:hypothetical protein
MTNTIYFDQNRNPYHPYTLPMKKFQHIRVIHTTMPMKKLQHIRDIPGHCFSRHPRELMKDAMYERYRRAKYRYFAVAYIVCL